MTAVTFQGSAVAPALHFRGSREEVESAPVAHSNSPHLVLSSASRSLYDSPQDSKMYQENTYPKDVALVAISSQGRWHCMYLAASVKQTGSSGAWQHVVFANPRLRRNFCIIITNRDCRSFPGSPNTGMRKLVLLRNNSTSSVV